LLFVGLKFFMAGRLARARNNGRMRPINLIVIHCSASPNADSLYRGQSGKPNFRNPAQTIDEWHVARKFHRADAFRQRQEPGLKGIGYHYVIDRSGLVLCGRHVDEVGAHAQGYNQKKHRHLPGRHRCVLAGAVVQPGAPVDLAKSPALPGAMARMTASIR
jgi:hypothetical protein